ncbi:hypothetical protein Barb6_00532 [Bacteroidales bacterium Barb6]|nr:hypothetical protein Barb6_00532 [Bacteroidales bacterium Barb6]
MKYDRIRKNPTQLLSLTGFDVTEFEAFLPTFKYHWEEYHSHFTLADKIRERITYNRKTSKIPLIEDKLLFVLSYLKNNPLQEYHGAACNMSQPQFNDRFCLLSDILCRTLKTLGKLPDRNHLKDLYKKLTVKLLRFLGLFQVSFFSLWISNTKT